MDSRQSDPATHLDDQTFGIVLKFVGLPEALLSRSISTFWKKSVESPVLWRKIDLADFKKWKAKGFGVQFYVDLFSLFPNVTDLRMAGLNLTGQILEAINDQCSKLTHLDLQCSDLFKYSEVKEERTLIRHHKLKTIDLRVLHSDGDIMVKIKTLTGSVVPIWVPDVNITIAQLKEYYERVEGVPADCQRYIYAGKRLEDGRRLCDYHYQDGTAMHLVLRLRGGRIGQTVKPKTEKKESYELKHPELKKFSDFYLEDEFAPKSYKLQNKQSMSVIPNVYSVPIFKEEIIAKLSSEVYNYQHQMHQDTIGTKKFESIGYLPFFQTFISSHIVPLSKYFFPKYQNRKMKDFDVFVVFYELGKDENFTVHQDPSDVTMNLCLSNTAKGCDLQFFSPSPSAAGEDGDTSKYVNFTPVAGSAVVHRGNLYHKVEQIHAGKRCNLIIWVRFE